MIGWMGLELGLGEVTLNLSMNTVNTGIRTPTTSHDIRSFRPRPSRTGISVRVHSETTTRRDDVELAMDPSMIASSLYSTNVYLDNLPKLPNAAFYAMPVSQDKDANASHRSFEDDNVTK